jgi:hypothetical protein
MEIGKNKIGKVKWIMKIIMKINKGIWKWKEF